MGMLKQLRWNTKAPKYKRPDVGETKKASPIINYYYSDHDSQLQTYVENKDSCK